MDKEQGMILAKLRLDKAKELLTKIAGIQQVENAGYLVEKVDKYIAGLNT